MKIIVLALSLVPLKGYGHLFKIYCFTENPWFFIFAFPILLCHFSFTLQYFFSLIFASLCNFAFPLSYFQCSLLLDNPPRYQSLHHCTVTFVLFSLQYLDPSSTRTPWATPPPSSLGTDHNKVITAAVVLFITCTSGHIFISSYSNNPWINHHWRWIFKKKIKNYLSDHRLAQLWLER